MVTSLCDLQTMIDKPTIPFDEYNVKFARASDRQADIPARNRAQLSVLLQKRFRGDTLGDRIGRWNYATNNWCEPEILDLVPMNIYTKNIVKPKVIGKASICAQAAIAVVCNPRQSEDTRSKKNAMISQKISDWVDDELWTSDLLVHINQGKQLSHGIFLKSFYNPQKEGKAFEHEDWEEQPFNEPATLICQDCGKSAPLLDVNDGIKALDEPDAAVSTAETTISNDAYTSSDDTAADDSIIPNKPCDDCGGRTEISESTDLTFDVLKKSKKYVKGDNDLHVVPSMAIRVDERYSQGGNLKRARYLEQFELMSRFEIEMEFGYDELGQSENWTYPMQWLYTLQTGIQFPFKTIQSTADTLRSLDLFEIRRIYRSCEFLYSYESPTDYEFINKAHPELSFSLKKGENAGEKVRKMATEDAEANETPVLKLGLCTIMCGDKILGYELTDFKKLIFDYTYFTSDPYSFWGLPCSELETHQHLVNQMLTAIGNQVQANKNKLVVDREAFDDEDLDGDSDIIHSNTNDRPVKEQFGIIPGTPVTADTWQLYQMSQQDADDANLFSPVMAGFGSNADTLGQERLRRDMSVGTLTPAQQSTAQAKVGVMEKQCRLVQLHWRPERLMALCGTSDGVITEDDINHYFRADLENQVIFSYLEGSEMPKTQVEKQMDVLEYSQFLIELAAGMPQAQLVTPELAYDLLNRMAQFKGIQNLDIQNAELDTEVAETRYAIIARDLEKNLQEQLQIQQDEQTLMINVVMATMDQPILEPLPTENHNVAMEYYRDKMMVEIKKEHPNLVMVGCCEEMINRHRKAAVELAQQKVMDTMEAQAPMMQMQQDQDAKAAAIQAESQKGQQEMEAAKIQAEDARTASNQEHQTNMKLLDMAGQHMQSEAKGALK